MIKVDKKRENDNYYIGTHNGIFHCDEVIAVAILSLLKGDVNVIRSRDIELLKNNTDILVDIGGGKFDHHQKGGNGKRDNDVLYASAGLVWKEYGSEVVKKLSNNELDPQEINLLVDIIDKQLIQNIDMEDNGQLLNAHKFQFITSFLPSWNSKEDYDKNFEQCANIVRVVLGKEILAYISKYLAEKEIYKNINDSEKHIGNVLVIPSQTIPWTDILIDYNDKSNSNIDFVVFPYPAGGWAIQCVPPSMDNKFGQRIRLPKEWAGETINLPIVSGIESATFCHNGRFFARANEYMDILKMGKIASQRHIEEQNALKLQNK